MAQPLTADEIAILVRAIEGGLLDEAVFVIGKSQKSVFDVAKDRKQRFKYLPLGVDVAERLGAVLGRAVDPLMHKAPDRGCPVRGAIWQAIWDRRSARRGAR